MADRVFEIEVKTTADTSGFKSVAEQLKEAGAHFDPKTKQFVSDTKEASDNAKEAADNVEKISKNAGHAGVSLARARNEAIILARELATGTVSMRTIGSLLGALGIPIAAAGAGLLAVFSAVNKLNKELDAQAEAAIRAMERVRELQKAFREATEWAEKLNRIRRLPLTDEIRALHYELTRLRTEQSLVNQSTEEGVRDAQKYQQQIDALKNSLEQATEKQKKLKEQAFEEEPRFETRAFKAAEPQVKALLEARLAAQRAQERGEYLAPVQVREAEDAIRRFRRVATPEQRAELEQLVPHLADILNELKKQTAQWQ